MFKEQQAIKHGSLECLKYKNSLGGLTKFYLPRIRYPNTQPMCYLADFGLGVPSVALNSTETDAGR